LPISDVDFSSGEETSSAQTCAMVKELFDAIVSSHLLRCSLGFAMSLCLSVNSVGAAETRPAPIKLRLEPSQILQQVARQMNVSLRPEVPLPKIFLESTTPLRQFQEAIAPQWKFRPHVFANAYVMARNEIYLSDDPSYYKRRNRTLDDSLAHEFVHYIQVTYRSGSLADDDCEMEAITVQLAFIDHNMPTIVASVSDWL
jgi:hypothetical protein